MVSTMPSTRASKRGHDCAASHGWHDADSTILVKRRERDDTATALSPGLVRELHRAGVERAVGRQQRPRLDWGLLRGHGARPRTCLLRLYDPRGHVHGV